MHSILDIWVDLLTLLIPFAGVEYQNALEASLELGYHFYLQSVAVFQECNNGNTILSIQATISNEGVAPFYYPLYLRGSYYRNGSRATSASIQCTQDIKLMDLSSTFNSSMTIDLSGKKEFIGC